MQRSFRELKADENFSGLKILGRHLRNLTNSRCLYSMQRSFRELKADENFSGLKILGRHLRNLNRRKKGYDI